MPIEMILISNKDKRSRRPLGYLMPGEYISFSDFPEGQEDIVAIHCLDDDSGGEVYRFR